MPKFSVVVAATRNGGIGLDQAIPWRLPSEMQHFKSLTTTNDTPGLKNVVIMGRKTWESIPSKFRPLNNRINVVLTRSTDKLPMGMEDGVPPSVILAHNFESSLDLFSEAQLAQTESEHGTKIGKIFVIGGSEIYRWAFMHPHCEKVYLSEVLSDFHCDTFIPPIDRSVFELTDSKTPVEEKGTFYQILTYSRRKPTVNAIKTAQPISAPNHGLLHEEFQYLNIVRDILETGIERNDRTGVGTLSKFGVTMRFSLRNDVLPLLTTKRVFWRGVAEELFWFLRGETSAKPLQEKNVRIWDGNASREFLDSRGLTHREEGDLGPVYGFQWRHFGAAYENCHTDYSGRGVDQLMNVIDTIRTNPTDRRIIMSAWNPAALAEMALPPCHMFCQFFVADGELSCQMYQRSADMGLGVPFNIASYALLTRLIAQVCGLKPGEFVHVIGDAHIYKNHIEPLKIQLERIPRTFPTLSIDPSVKNIEEFTFDHLKVHGYKPHKTIKMEMAV